VFRLILSQQLFLYLLLYLKFRLCSLCGTDWTFIYYVDERIWSTSCLLPTENSPIPNILPSPLPKLTSKHTFKGRTSGQCLEFFISMIFFVVAVKSVIFLMTSHIFFFEFCPSLSLYLSLCTFHVPCINQMYKICKKST
jgi:hypothetical protein